MIENSKIAQRLKVLQFDISDINLYYKESLKDPVIECGMEYNKQYPYNEETINRLNNQENLQKAQADKLYCRIFNFTQTYYSIKEYLRKLYPQHKSIIEDFFSNDKIGLISRKDICNDLKHKPEKDLKYKTNLVREVTKSETKMQILITNFGKTWFYDKVDSVALCNDLYNELLMFLENSNF
jgi:hypothetical protein